MKGNTVMHVYIKYVLMGNTGLMVIRRGDISDIGWVFVGLEMNCLIILSPGRSVDYVPPLHHTTRCFDKPQTPVLFTHIWASVVLAIGNYVCQGLGGAIFE